MSEIPPDKQEKPSSPPSSPPGASRRGRPSSRGKWGLLAGLLILGYSLMREPPSPPPSEPPQALQAQQAEPHLFDNDAEVEIRQEDELERSKILLLERAAHLNPVFSEVDERGQRDLNLRIEVNERNCSLGDFDAMTRDQQLLGTLAKGFVLSLENLSHPTSGKNLQVPLSLDVLQKGFEHRFVFPAEREHSLWGLFLCSGGIGASCHKKSIINVEQLMQLQRRVMFPEAGARTSYPHQEKVFFFQFLVLFPDRVLLHDSRQSLDTSFRKIEDALKAASKISTSPALLETIKLWLRDIGSVSGEITPASVLLRLPTRMARCGP